MIARLVAAVLCCVVPLAAAAQEVLVTRAQALHEIFPEGVRIETERRLISDESRAALERSLGRHIAEREVEVSLVFAGDGSLRGYAVVAEEIGKYRPITFMVGITPDVTIRDVAVMAYRESRGGDVRRRRFLAQYRGKRPADPIDSNRDIINISGATISVRSMNAGVKRVLAEIAVLYPAAPRAAAASPE